MLVTGGKLTRWMRVGYWRETDSVDARVGYWREADSILRDSSARHLARVEMTGYVNEVTKHHFLIIS